MIFYRICYSYLIIFHNFPLNLMIFQKCSIFCRNIFLTFLIFYKKSFFLFFGKSKVCRSGKSRPIRAILTSVFFDQPNVPIVLNIKTCTGSESAGPFRKTFFSERRSTIFLQKSPIWRLTVILQKFAQRRGTKKRVSRINDHLDFKNLASAPVYEKKWEKINRFVLL